LRAYEGLFLVDEGKASDDFQAVSDHIGELLTRHGATVGRLEKWDSRRLAYPIERKKRGTYVLAKFELEPAQVAGLTEDCRLSRVILRCVVLREERVGMALEEAEEACRERRRAVQKPEPKPAPQPAAPEPEAPQAVGDAGAPERPAAENAE